jgi:hypothetical protein
MTRPIQQRVRFHASPEALFATFMDSKKHSASTGARAVISRKVGGKFTAHNGALAGRNLVVIPNRMVVQAWGPPIGRRRMFRSSFLRSARFPTADKWTWFMQTFRRTTTRV